MWSRLLFGCFNRFLRCWSVNIIELSKRNSMIRSWSDGVKWRWDPWLTFTTRDRILSPNRPRWHRVDSFGRINNGKPIELNFQPSKLPRPHKFQPRIEAVSKCETYRWLLSPIAGPKWHKSTRFSTRYFSRAESYSLANISSLAQMFWEYLLKYRSALEWKSRVRVEKVY